MENKKEIEDKKEIKIKKEMENIKEMQNKKELICRIAGLLFEKGLVSGKDGNISIRTGEDEMLVTPSGICKGFLAPEMIIRQRFDGAVIEGSYKSTREAAMHSRLYELRPDIGAIVHTHPAAATAFAVCGKGFPENWVLEVPSLIGKIGIAGYAPAGSRQLVEEVEKTADSDVIFLLNHGVITYGPDIYDAFSRMDAVENTAKTILYAQFLGGAREF